MLNALSFAAKGLGAAVRAKNVWPALSKLPAHLPALTPPIEFPSRIEKLPEGSASIDNELYSDPAHAATWHSEDTSSELATLQLLNAARIPYFDRVWRQQLRLGPARPGSFLEVGCGGGIATAALAGLGYHMTGVEPAIPSLEAAREHARCLELQDRLTFVSGSAYDLSAFPDECFDGVLMADVLEHLYDLPAVRRWRARPEPSLRAAGSSNCSPSCSPSPSRHTLEPRQSACTQHALSMHSASQHLSMHSACNHPDPRAPARLLPPPPAIPSDSL